jgi:predicted nucleic acid-binding protein
MGRSYFDTSVLVPAALAQHPHHEAALARFKELTREKQRGYISAHGITEFYSVMTRTPFKPPLHPSEAWRLIEEVILERLELVTLTAKEVIELTRGCAISGWTGGRIHDAMHLRCAKKSQCDRIYTFNVKDFRALAGPEMLSQIITP